ncbi:MAG: gliding motility lipoprotein GldH [Flavobacteriales bacterium]|nr:gliding motility lipoprotein GldH [Flavobacteriales bacterium]
MKNSSIFLVVIVAFLLSSCHPNRVFREFNELPDYVWEKNNPQSFEVEITDIKASYDLIVGVRYASGFQNLAIQLNSNVIGPNEYKTNEVYSISIVDANGKYLGEPSLDIWDLETIVKEGITFTEPGTYTYTLTHLMPNDKLYFTMEVGLILDKQSE